MTVLTVGSPCREHGGGGSGVGGGWRRERVARTQNRVSSTPVPWPTLILGQTLGLLCPGGLLLRARHFVSTQMCGHQEVQAADRWERKPGLRPYGTDWGHHISPQSHRASSTFIKRLLKAAARLRGHCGWGWGSGRLCIEGQSPNHCHIATATALVRHEA